jgi:ribonuclease P protein component
VLPAARRIRRADEFRTVLRARSRAAGATLVVHVAVLDAPTTQDRPVRPASPAPPARAGFVVGRAVGGSVVRHRVTRQLRHLMVGHLPALPDGVGVVVRALPPAAGADSATMGRDLAANLDRALRRLGQDRGSRREAQR